MLVMLSRLDLVGRQNIKNDVMRVIPSLHILHLDLFVVLCRVQQPGSYCDG